jgi:hypothetical protein
VVLKRPSVEDVIIWGAVLIVVLIMLWFLVGCQSSKQTKYQVRYVKGCAIDLTVMTADTANEIMKGVDMTDCEMDADTEDAKDEKQEQK